MAGYAMLSLMPDADVIAFPLGIPYADPFGHRGASHAIVIGVALGALCALVPGDRRERIRAATVGVAVAVSHGLLDACTDGGLGVALLWPLSDARFFAPWRPLPVSPIGAGLLSMRGLRVVLVESVIFAPLLLYAFWPRRKKP